MCFISERGAFNYQGTVIVKCDKNQAHLQKYFQQNLINLILRVLLSVRPVASEAINKVDIAELVKSFKNKSRQLLNLGQ